MASLDKPSPKSSSGSITPSWCGLWISFQPHLLPFSAFQARCQLALLQTGKAHSHSKVFASALLGNVLPCHGSYLISDLCSEATSLVILFQTIASKIALPSHPCYFLSPFPALIFPQSTYRELTHIKSLYVYFLPPRAPPPAPAGHKLHKVRAMICLVHFVSSVPIKAPVTMLMLIQYVSYWWLMSAMLGLARVVTKDQKDKVNEDICKRMIEMTDHPIKIG